MVRLSRGEPPRIPRAGRRGSLELPPLRVFEMDALFWRTRTAESRMRRSGHRSDRSRPVRGLELGRQATQRLKGLIANAETVEIEKVACSCPPGTHGTNKCNFGRSCGIMRVNGTDVGRTLISEGLAARFKCGRTSCPPTPRPWCR